MKPFQYSSALRLILFLMLITSFTTAVAYDFESGGIYYNITSSNTVEVTYGDSYYNSYSGDLEIPSFVTNNSIPYTVNAIGEDAFYGCNDLRSVIIPATVTFINRNAFFNCYNLEAITCMASTPPSLNGQVYNGCLSSGYSYGVLYNYYNNFENELYTSGIDAVLYVPTEVYDIYKNNNDWTSNFSIIARIGAEQTTPPTIIAKGFDDYSYYGYQFADSMYVSFVPGEDCKIFVGNTTTGRWPSHSHGTDWNEYNGGKWHPSMFYDGVYSSPYTVHCTVYAYAVAEGKAPSPVVYLNELYYSPDNIVVSDEISEYDIPYSMNSGDVFYDLEKDGLYFHALNDSSLEVVNGLVNHCTEHHLYFAGPKYNYEYVLVYDEYHYEDSLEVLYYKGDIVIPKYESGESISIFGTDFVDGNVTSIRSGAFSDCTGLLSVKIPSTIISIDSYAFSGCDEIPSFTLPSSVQSIGYNCFNGSSIHYLNLTNNGSWSGGALDVVVQRLGIASGITAIPGLQVNPREVYCYAKVPPTCDENTFTDYTGTLHVPESSLAAYFTAPYWCNFANIVGDAVELQNISLNKDIADLQVGDELRLKVTLQPTNASVDSIQWKSSNSSIATVTSDGVVTAMALGECDIIATCLDKRDTCHVKVVEQIVTISLDQHHASILPNHILTLTPTVSPSSTPLVVTSSNPAVAAARLTNGVVQVVGISPGTSVIKVSSADDDAFADSCLVNVYTEVGDVDGDGFVKIDDVTTIIDYLLGGSASNFNAANADVDFDGDIDISDVTELIDHLLSGGTWQNERFMVNGVPFTMVRVAAGSFMMGATEEQGDEASSWEKPVHSVTLSSYMIGQTEVTQELWQAVMGTNPSLHSGSLQKPVENVSWDDCQAFITQLNALTGQHFRMPTEAEWEYAARGGNKSLGYKYAGSNNIDEVGWVTGTTTHPVGELQPNELGLYDMSGNVDEWVWDYFGYYSSEPQTDPTGPETGDNRMYRGGSWYGGANASRVSYRFFRAPTFKRGTMGLRLVL